MKTLSSCVLLLSMLYAASAVGQCEGPAAGRVSWWQAEGNALDSADGNHGTLQGGVTFQPGAVGQAFGLDGVNDHVFIPDAANLDGMAQLSVEAWAKFAMITPGKWQWIISKGSAIGFGSNSYSLWLAGDNLKIQAAVESATGLNTVGAPDVIVPNRFYHVAFTYDGTAIRLYLDGLFRGQGLLNGSVRNTFFPVFIGRRSGGGVDGRGDVIGGAIDEVKLYSRALTSDEIVGSFVCGGIQLLIIRVEELDLEHGQRNNLTNKLEHAQKELAQGDFEKAKKRLNQFIERVEKLEQDGKLDAPTADSLIADAQLLISRL